MTYCQLRGPLRVVPGRAPQMVDTVDGPRLLSNIHVALYKDDIERCVAVVPKTLYDALFMEVATPEEVSQSAVQETNIHTYEPAAAPASSGGDPDSLYD